MPKAQKNIDTGKNGCKRSAATAAGLSNVKPGKSAKNGKQAPGAAHTAARGKQKEDGPASTSSTAGQQPLRMAGYTVLPLRYAASQSQSQSQQQQSQASAAVSMHDTIHYLYIRQDKAAATRPSASASAAAQQANRSLFVANLPIDATERHLRLLFKNAGAIEKVVFQQGSSVPLSGQHILDALDNTEPIDEDVEDDEHDDEEQASTAHISDPAKLEAALAAELQQQRMDESQGKNRRKQKKNGTKAEQEPIPQVSVLPALDPREAAGARALLPTCTSAHVIFLDASSLQRAITQAEQTSAAFASAGGFSSPDTNSSSMLAILKAARPWTDPYAPSGASTRPALANAPAEPPALGLPYLLAAFNAQRPPLDRIKSFADSRINLHIFLRAHPDRDPRERAKLAQRRIQAVRVGAEDELLDEDGFTIVTSGGKYGRSAEAGSGGAVGESGASVRVARNLPHMASGTAYEAAMGPPKKKSKSKDLEDFYRFQTREKNREKLAQLRAKFQEDKAKVAKLKESRKFKPY